MHQCPLLDTCRFMNRIRRVSSAQAKAYERAFCMSVYTDCARFKVADAIGLEHVPDALLPLEKEQAEQIIAEFAPNE